MASDTNTLRKDLGPVSAYAVAVAHGFDGTEAEWEQYIANASTNAAQASASATAAAQSEANAETAKEAAVTAKVEAQTAAQSASAAYGTSLLAPNYSTEATYTVGQHVIYSGNLYSCTTAITTPEAWDATHWTQVQVGNEVSDLKSALGVIYTSENLTTSLTSGGYILLSGVVGSIVSDTPVSNASYSWIKIPVKHGDRIVFSCKGGGNPRAWAVTDENRKILSVADANVTVENYVLTIDQIGYVYINNNSPFTASVIHETNELDYYNSILDSYKGKTISKTIASANTTNAIAYNFLKGQTVKLENNTSGAMSVNLYEADGTYHAISRNLTSGENITFVVEYNNCIQIGGFCGGTGSIDLTIVDLNNVVDAKVNVVDAKVDVADAKVDVVDAKVDANLLAEKDRSLADLSWTDNSYIKTNGTVASGNLYRYSSLIPVKTGSSIAYDLDNANNVAVTICAYDALENLVLSKSIYYDPDKGTGIITTFTGTYVIPDGISFVRICHQIARASQTVTVPELVNAVQEFQKDLEEIKTELNTFDLTNQWKDKKWVAFGTSITDNYSQNSYITQGDHAGEHTGKYVPYLIDMSELSESKFVNRGIAGGSINGHILYYIRYYTSDQANADLITIEGAVNDFATSVPLGNVGDTVPYTNSLLSDSTADGTFAGACYQAFTTALTNAPNAVVVLLTETTGKDHVGYANYNQLRKNSLGLYQSDYIEMTMKVAEFVGIPVINCGRDSMINAQNPQYIADHIHHTYLGGYQYAQTIWAKLKGIPTKALAVPN